MKEINGDLVEMADNGQFSLIVHGCNCQSVMGSGIAKTQEIIIALKGLDINKIQKDLDKLKDDSLLLNCLNSAGVDNWAGIDFAYELYNEMEKG